MDDSDDDRLEIDMEASARKKRTAEERDAGGEVAAGAEGGETDDGFKEAKKRKQGTGTSSPAGGQQRTDQAEDKKTRTAYIKGKDRCIVSLNSKKVNDEITRDFGKVKEISVGRVCLRVECTSQEQRERLLAMTMLLGHRVGTTKPFEPRQTSDRQQDHPRPQGQRRWEKGVIVGVATDISDEDIKTDAAAVKVTRIMKRSGNGQSVATTAVILFFDGPRPDSVYIGRRYTVRDYIPRTIQCYRCRGFFHTASSCTQGVRCPSCGEGHSHDECPLRNSASALHCANCGGNHNAAFRECPSFMEARVATRVAVQTGKSYAEALKQVQREAKEDGGNNDSRNDPRPQPRGLHQREERAPRGASRALIFPQSTGPAPRTNDDNQESTQPRRTDSASAYDFPALPAPATQQSSASAPMPVRETVPGEAVTVGEFVAKATDFVKAMLNLEKHYVHSSLKSNFATEILAASFSLFPFLDVSKLLPPSNPTGNPPLPMAPSPAAEGV